MLTIAALTVAAASALILSTPREHERTHVAVFGLKLQDEFGFVSPPECPKVGITYLSRWGVNSTQKTS